MCHREELDAPKLPHLDEKASSVSFPGTLSSIRTVKGRVETAALGFGLPLSDPLSQDRDASSCPVPWATPLRITLLACYSGLQGSRIVRPSKNMAKGKGWD